MADGRQAAADGGGASVTAQRSELRNEATDFYDKRGKPVREKRQTDGNYEDGENIFSSLHIIG